MKLTNQEQQLLKHLTKNYILLPTNQEKKPLVSNWNNYRNYYKELRTIEQLLTLNHSYGLRTGKLVGGDYYFIVLDLDDLWSQERLKVTRYIQTNRGIHCYCLIRELPTNSWLFTTNHSTGEPKKIGELHSQGRFVIGIGSIHAQGTRYTLKGRNNERYFYKWETIQDLELFLQERGIYCKPWGYKQTKIKSNQLKF